QPERLPGARWAADRCLDSARGADRHGRTGLLRDEAHCHQGNRAQQALLGQAVGSASGSNPMMLVVDPDSGTPPYAQLRQQWIGAIRTGELPPGSKLPTVRRLAGDLGIAPNTVARTYQELERD